MKQCLQLPSQTYSTTKRMKAKTEKGVCHKVFAERIFIPKIFDFHRFYQSLPGKCSLVEHMLARWDIVFLHLLNTFQQFLLWIFSYILCFKNFPTYSAFKYLPIMHAKNVWCWGDGYFGQKKLRKKCVNRDKM